MRVITLITLFFLPGTFVSVCQSSFLQNVADGYANTQFAILLPCCASHTYAYDNPLHAGKWVFSILPTCQGPIATVHTVKTLTTDQSSI